MRVTAPPAKLEHEFDALCGLIADEHLAREGTDGARGVDPPDADTEPRFDPGGAVDIECLIGGRRDWLER